MIYSNILLCIVERHHEERVNEMVHKYRSEIEELEKSEAVSK